jgi:hypothetical protein
MEEAAAERAIGEVTGRAVFWQGYAYEAYVLRFAGEPAAAAAKLDTAWLAARSDAARSALDSVRVSEFGLQSLLETGPTVPSDPPGS